MAYPATKYVISKYGDPCFAMAVGLTAAILRIRDEETRKRAGLPSSSMVISPAQHERIEEERALRKRRGKPETYADVRRGLDIKEDDWYTQSYSVMNSLAIAKDGTMEIVPIQEILHMFKHRLAWKWDYWWYDRGAQETGSNSKST